MPKDKEARKLRKEGEPGGYAEVAFDREKRERYHLNTLGERVVHGLPDGFAYDDEGGLVPLT